MAMSNLPRRLLRGGVLSKEYTPEEARTIVAGLAAGKPANHRPMTDREWQRRYSPETDRQERQLVILEDIRDTLHDQRP